MVRILVLQGGKWIRIRVSQGERLVHPTVVLAHEEEVRAEIRLNLEKIFVLTEASLRRRLQVLVDWIE